MKTIIFDIDGTLTNTKEVDDKCYLRAFQKVFDVDIRNQNWSAFRNVSDWGITEEIFLNEWNRVPTDKEYKALQEEFIHQLKIEKDRDPSQFLEVNGAKILIKFLKELDHPLGIATGGWEESAKLKLDAAGIEIEDLGFSNSSRFKTRQDILKDVIFQLSDDRDFEPTDIIYFGDGMWDMLTCRKMGIHFIGIDYDGNQKLKDAGVIPVFKDFSDGDTIIDIINNGGIGMGMIDLDF